MQAGLFLSGGAESGGLGKKSYNKTLGSNSYAYDKGPYRADSISNPKMDETLDMRIAALIK
jgi:hypothetical protein